MIVGDSFTPGTFVDAFRFIADNASLMLDKTGETAELSFAALGVALLLSLPVGLWLGHRHRGLSVALGVATLGRALPIIALIAIFITLFGTIGFWVNMPALVVLAIPPLLTNSYFGVEGVDRDVVEAARGMGLEEPQILSRVELPLGLPLLLAGVRLAAVFVIATATIAGTVGGGGLGEIIANQASYGLSGVLAAALCVSALALLTAFVIGLAQRAASRRMAPRA
ncbi:MAG TPA: ABC transporter permease subunit [Gaiellaceae bacterium]|nr:ABC transporter permease subunit [Gaiellaceae bacterium]